MILRRSPRSSNMVKRNLTTMLDLQTADSDDTVDARSSELMNRRASHSWNFQQSFELLLWDHTCPQWSWNRQNVDHKLSTIRGIPQVLRTLLRYHTQVPLENCTRTYMAAYGDSFNEYDLDITLKFFRASRQVLQWSIEYFPCTKHLLFHFRLGGHSGMFPFFLWDRSIKQICQIHSLHIDIVDAIRSSKLSRLELHEESVHLHKLDRILANSQYHRPEGIWPCLGQISPDDQTHSNNTFYNHDWDGLRLRTRIPHFAHFPLCPTAQV